MKDIEKKDKEKEHTEEHHDKKSKSEWNQKYTLIAVYSFIVIISSFAVILLILGVRDFFIKKEYANFFKIFTPIIYGFILAYLLNPLFIFFQNKVFFKFKRGLKKIFSLFAAYLTMIIVITLILLMIIPQVISSVQQLTGIATDWFTPVSNTNTNSQANLTDGEEQQAIENSKIVVYLKDLGASIQDYLDRMNININVEETFDQMSRNLISLISGYISPALNYTAGVIYHTASGLLDIFLGLLLSIYLLAGKDKFIAQVKKLLFAVFPAGFSYKFVNVTRKTHEIFGGFITGKIIDSVVVGSLCFIGMTVLRLRYPALISLIVAVFNLIPFFGPIAGALISVFFLAIYDIWQAVWFFIFIIILMQIDGNIIDPKISGSKVGLSTFWVIVAIIVSGGLFGPVAMVFGVPIFAVIYVLIKEFAENRLISKGFPVETGHYVRNQGDGMGIEDGDYESGNKNIHKESRLVFIGKTMNTIAKNITGRFSPGKKAKKPDNNKNNTDNDNNEKQ